jgi:hypothetical protein
MKERKKRRAAPKSPNVNIEELKLEEKELEKQVREILRTPPRRGKIKKRGRVS